MNNTKIEWTDATWSPLRARVKENAAEIAKAKGYTSLIQVAEKMAGHVGPHCEHVSPGCENCYAGTNNHRCLPTNRTGLPFDRRSRDLIEPFVDEKLLLLPLKWRAPKKIFVENQSDLFGEWVSDEQIDRVLAVMALCPQHTFQIPTKRPARMADYLREMPEVKRLPGFREWGGSHANVFDQMVALLRGGVDPYALNRASAYLEKHFPEGDGFIRRWPLHNVWVGVSVENQATADERIPLLLQTPAAVRFVSYEPALGPVNFDTFPLKTLDGGENPGIDWVICGGESGPGARPFDIKWARNAVGQCGTAGVACFVKQLGANPQISRYAEADYGTEFLKRWGNKAIRFADRKGGDWNEWPEDLRVREFPALVEERKSA